MFLIHINKLNLITSIKGGNVLNNFSLSKRYKPYHGPFDPCPPLPYKTYVTPPHLYIGYQPYGLPQYSPKEALKKGTLWPAFYDHYENPYENK
jgi:spore coat protein JA